MYIQLKKNFEKLCWNVQCSKTSSFNKSYQTGKKSESSENLKIMRTIFKTTNMQIQMTKRERAQRILETCLSETSMEITPAPRV